MKQWEYRVSTHLQEQAADFEALGDKGWEFCGTDAYGRHVWKREIQPPGEHHSVEQLEAWLAECYKLSGADPDGDENWRLAPRALEAVREMRRFWNEAESALLGNAGEDSSVLQRTEVR